MIVRNLSKGGRKNSSEGIIKTQFKDAPPIIDRVARINVGREQKISVSESGCNGLILVGPHTTAKRNRVVYVTVKPVEKKNRIRITKFEG